MSTSGISWSFLIVWDIPILISIEAESDEIPINSEGIQSFLTTILPTLVDSKCFDMCHPHWPEIFQYFGLHVLNHERLNAHFNTPFGHPLTCFGKCLLISVLYFWVGSLDNFLAEFCKCFLGFGYQHFIWCIMCKYILPFCVVSFYCSLSSFDVSKLFNLM